VALLLRFVSVLAETTLAGTVPSCLMCNDPGCDGGLQLEIRDHTGGLVAGEWTLEVDADGDAFEVACTLTELAASSTCTVPGDTGEWHVSAFVRGDELPETGDWTGPPRSIAVTIEGGDPHAHEYDGPTTTTVEIVVDGMMSTDETFVPEYDRTFHRGPQSCGHCDRAEVELVVE